MILPGIYPHNAWIFMDRFKDEVEKHLGEDVLL